MLTLVRIIQYGKLLWGCNVEFYNLLIRLWFGIKKILGLYKEIYLLSVKKYYIFNELIIFLNIKTIIKSFYVNYGKKAGKSLSAC